MILIIGLVLSLYISYIIIGSFGTAPSYLGGFSRIMCGIILIYTLWLIKVLIIMPDNMENVIFMDGLCKINKYILYSEIFLMVLVLIMLQLLGTDFKGNKPQLFLILLTNIIGLSNLLSSNDLVLTITSWELMNLSLYLLVTMVINKAGSSLSSGIKYFLLSALTTAFIFMGIGLIYKKTGSTNYDILYSIKELVYYTEVGQNTINNTTGGMTLGLAFILFSITLSFKLGSAPFYNWAPDLYDSIPTPLTMLMSTLPKFAILLFMINLSKIFINITGFWYIVGILSIIIGSIGLRKQYRIKRFMAYSAITHLGFILIAYASLSYSSFIYYIYIYGFSSILFFIILVVISNTLNRDINVLEDLSGVFKNNRYLAIGLIIAIFSLAGIPPLAGFFGKLEVLKGLFYAKSTAISIIVILSSIISTSNYLRLIKMSQFNKPLYKNKYHIKPLYSYLIAVLGYFIGGFFIYLSNVSILCSYSLSICGPLFSTSASGSRFSLLYSLHL